MKKQNKDTWKLVNDIVMITIILCIMLSIAILIIAITFPDKEPAQWRTVNDTRLFYNGHPINSSEAQRLGTVSIEELRKLYPK